MARRGGRRGSRGRSSSRRSRGRTGGVGSSRSKSKSNKSKSTGGSRGRSSNTRGGQSKANRNQNKKARRTVKSASSAARSTVKSVSKAIGKATRGAAANAASAVANSSLASKYNRKKRDMSKLTPQSRRRYERLSQKTGRDYSQRIPSMKINLSADRLAQFAGVSDKGWYKGLTSRFPGIKKLQINKQLYSNPMKKGWHSSQRTGRGQGLTPEAATMGQLASLRADPSQDIGRMYQNILGRESDQEGLDYWTNEFKSGRQNLDDIRRQFVRSDEFQGRSDADKSSALDGLKKRRMKRGLPRETRGVPKGRENDYRLLPMPMPTTGPKKGKGNNYGDQFIGHFGIGIPGSQEYRRSTPKRKGKPKRGGMRSIGAALASMRGGI